MDNESEANPFHFKLSLLKPKKSVKHNKNKNVSMKSLKKDLDNLEANIDYRKISIVENYGNKDDDGYTEVKIPTNNQTNVEQIAAVDKDVYSSKYGTSKKRAVEVVKQNFNNSEPFINPEKDELKSNISESNFSNTVLDNCPNISKLLDQINSNANVEVLQKSMKRRKIKLKNSKSKRSRTDKEINFLEKDVEHDQIIAKENKELEYNAINLESSKFNDEDVAKSSQSIVEQAKQIKKEKSDTNKTKTPKKCVKKIINNSETSSDHSLLYSNGLEIPINNTVIDNRSELSESQLDNLQAGSSTVIDNGPELSTSHIGETTTETNSNNLQSEIDTVVDMGPNLSQSQLVETDANNSVINNGPEILKAQLKVGRPESKNLKSYFDSTRTGSKLNDKNDTEINVDSDMHNVTEMSLDELNISKPRTEINHNFSRSNSINGKDLVMPPSIVALRRNPRRKSIYKSLVDAAAINGDQGSFNLNAEENTVVSQKRESRRSIILDEEPQKRGNPKSTQPEKKTYIAKLKPNGKITKCSIQATSYRKIPKNRLEDALEMLHNEDHPIWVDNNISCNPGIHRYWDTKTPFVSDQNLKLKYARQFLLRRDWLNLSKVLSLSTLDTKQKTTYYPLLSKYAALCLAHTDKEQFNNFLQFLVGMDAASNPVIKKCTTIIQKNEE